MLRVAGGPAAPEGAAPTSRRTSGRRNPDLDGFRGVAICLVLLDHAFGQSIPYAVNGWVGVDVFFVLSGFLITSILLGMRGHANYFRLFYARRSRRIFPAFYLILLIDGAVSLVEAKHGKPAVWLISATFLTSVLQIHFFQAAQALTAAVFWNLQSLWSVSIEELFYLLWAPLVRFLNTRWLVSLLAFVLCMEPAVRCLMFRAHYPIYSAFAGRLDGLAAGALIAFVLACGNLRAAALRRLSSLLLISMLLADALALPQLHLRVYTLRFALAGYLLIAWTTASLLLWLLVRQAESTWIQRLLRWPFLQLAGRRSFMLYLVSQLVCVPLLAWGSRHPWGTAAQIGIGMVCCAACFAFAELSWRFVEGPILATRVRPEERSPLHLLSRTSRRRAS